MKVTGIVRRIDDLGRVCLPKEFRDVLDMESGSKVEMSIEGDRIMIGRYGKSCVFCGDECAALHEFWDKHVCDACLRALCEKE